MILPILLGVGIGWFAFTEQGRATGNKVADQIGNLGKGQLKKVMNNFKKGTESHVDGVDTTVTATGQQVSATPDTTTTGQL